MDRSNSLAPFIPPAFSMFNKFETNRHGLVAKRTDLKSSPAVNAWHALSPCYEPVINSYRLKNRQEFAEIKTLIYNTYLVFNGCAFCKVCS